MQRESDRHTEAVEKTLFISFRINFAKRQVRNCSLSNVEVFFLSQDEMQLDAVAYNNIEKLHPGADDTGLSTISENS